MNPAPPSRVASVAPVAIQQGMETQPAADAAAFFLLGLLLFCLAAFIFGAVVLANRKKRLNAVAMENTLAGGAKTKSRSSLPQAPPWERDADWWKKSR